MVMQHCGIKRKLADGGPNHNDGDLHQQSLLDLSVQKLQEEQVKHGIEPRLLRFVLINNAIKALQAHLMDSDDSFTLFKRPSSDLFLSNTLSHGSLSAPPSPAKVAKLDSDHFQPPTNSSLTSNSCTFSTLETDGDNDVYIPTPTPLMPGSEVEPRLKAISSSCRRGSTGSEAEYKKKRPRPLTLSVEDHLPVIQAGSDESDEYLSSSSTESSSLSPIDFAKVDVSLYDFDARTNLLFPQETSSRHPSGPSGLACSMQAAQTSGTVPKLEHVDELHQEQEDEDDEELISGNEQAVGGRGGEPPSSASGSVASSTSSSSVSSLSPDGFDSFDDNHEIDRIVSLLMA